MSLAPVNKSQLGYNAVDNGMPTSSWGAGIAKGVDSKYHMYVDELTHHCGINSWFTNSIVTHAVSDTPLGPYTRTGPRQLFPPFSTNPTIARGQPITHRKSKWRNI